MNQKNKKGFTLIELLVVIAIVGILSGVILVNLSGESDKASNARIKADMAQLRTAMESDRVSDANLGYDDPDTIGATFKTDMDSNGATSWLEYHSTSAWCTQVVLKGTGAGSWCVDSSGYAGATAACDNGTFDCATD
ncbi:MAG: type II secretion system protein [Candidatus Pacebacteria bacterium]|nr:type II secretion system protein [Candidatus Paceibacterota bacterium]